MDDDELRPEDVRRKIGKLPQWARRYIEKLEADYVSLKAERNEINEQESPIWYSPDWESRLYIPNRAVITFHLPTGDIEFRLRNGVILVEGDYPYVMPDASNCMTIGLRSDKP